MISNKLMKHDWYIEQHAASQAGQETWSSTTT